MSKTPTPVIPPCQWWRTWLAADGTVLLICPMGTLGELHNPPRQATWRGPEPKCNIPVTEGGAWRRL